MSSSPFVSWPSDQGGPARPRPYGYPPPDHLAADRAGTSVAVIVLAALAAPFVLVLTVALAAGLFVVAAPAAAVAVPAGAVMLTICRPRVGNRNRTRNSDTRPASASRQRPTRKTSPPLSNYRYKKG